jgi:hypothetical protein
MAPYVYIFVREDLNAEQQVIQAAHAALESAYRFPLSADAEPFLVTLGVDDVDALTEAQERITRKGIRSFVFFEPDHAIGFSALATEPITSGQKRKVFFPYRLFRAGARGAASSQDDAGGSRPSPGASRAEVAQR